VLTVAEVLERVERAEVFFGARVESVHTERFDGETALHIVAKWGDAEAIRVLAAGGADINKRGEDNNTPLHYAVMMDHLAAAQALVELGAARLEDIYGNTASMLTDDEDVRRYLVEHGF
jgi:ankyrin repeat protein